MVGLFTFVCSWIKRRVFYLSRLWTLSTWLFTLSLDWVATSPHHLTFILLNISKFRHRTHSDWHHHTVASQTSVIRLSAAMLPCNRNFQLTQSVARFTCRLQQLLAGAWYSECFVAGVVVVYTVWASRCEQWEVGWRCCSDENTQVPMSRTCYGQLHVQCVWKSDILQYF